MYFLVYRKITLRDRKTERKTERQKEGQKDRKTKTQLDK